MKKWITCILVIISSLAAFAQNDSYSTSVLKKLITKVEKEYPGFETKTKDIAAYNGFKNNLLNSSLTVEKDSCLNILKAYLSYFKDGHLVIYKTGNSNNDVTNYSGKSINIDVANFAEYVEKSKDSLEGIWTTNNYKVGLIRNKGRYEAFIISSSNESWKKNEIKFTLDGNGKAVYYMGNHSQIEEKYAILKNCILYFENANAAFVREIPKPLIASNAISAELDLLEGFYIKELNSKTLLLKISSFDPVYTKRITKLIDDNKKLLNNHKNLIIDLRGNGGGTDFSFRPILPYIYSNPVRFLGGEYLVTQTLIDGLKKLGRQRSG